MPKRYPTLPNCDLCGRFTSDPTEVSECRGIGRGGYACSDLLLCPRCAEHEEGEMPSQTRIPGAERDRIGGIKQAPSGVLSGPPAQGSNPSGGAMQIVPETGSPE